MNPENHDQGQQTTTAGDVATGGDFVGRDSHHHGDKIAGNKVQIDQATTVAGGDVYQSYHDYRALLWVMLSVLGVLVGAFLWSNRQTTPAALPPPVTVIVPAPPPSTPTTTTLAFAPATPEETLIIVPLYDNRSEGELQGVNPSSQIYDLVFKAALEHQEAKVRVEYYDQTIRTSEAAQSLGAHYQAKIVLWGWYNALKVQPYVELVGERTIQGEGVPIATPTPMAFYFLEEIPTQAAYLGLYMMGMAHIARDSRTELQRAIAFFSAALNAVVAGVKTNPWEAYVWRANCYSLLKEYEKALPDYDQAIRLNPEDATAYFNRGLAYAVSGKYEQAIQDYSEAIRLKPDYVAAYLGRGNVYDAIEKYEQAIEDYTEAIRLKPDFADGYWGRGNVYGAMEKYEQAIQEYNEAIRLKPDYANVYFSRAVAYISMNQSELAIADFEKFLTISDDPYWRKEAERHLSELRKQ